LQLSYSRRVRRPFYNDLSPYVTFSDNRNFFSGNPDLDPEFSNVVEIGHIYSFDKGSVTSSIYQRSTKGRIDRIRKVDELGNAVTRTENLLAEYAYGVELTSGFSPKKWWKVDFNFNFFHAKIDGSNILPDYVARTYSWFARQTSRFMLKKGLDLQWRMNYEAPQKTVQGRRKGLFYADLSASKDIFKENGTLTLNILDVFNTRKSRNVFNGSNFYYDGYSGFRPRQINLTIAYRIKQNKGTKTVKIIQD
jgi:ferric enterobactin receptor